MISDCCDTISTSPPPTPTLSIMAVASAPSTSAPQFPWPPPSSADDGPSCIAIPPTTTFHTISSISSRKVPETGCTSSIASSWRRFTAKLQNMDRVKLAYLRTSFIFAVSVLVTWTPSSINRVYTLIYPTRISFGLNIASAVVLPLQGMWNALIYFTTSWTGVREEIQNRWQRSRRMRRLGAGARLDTPERRERFGASRVDLARFEHSCRQENAQDHDVEMSPRFGTVRVMKGGHFDDPLRF